MPILDSIQFKVFGGGNSCTAGGHTYDDTFAVKREGIGWVIVSPDTVSSTESGEVYTYTRKSEKPTIADLNTYIIKRVESRIISTYSAQFEVGASVPIGAMYSITLLGETVTYTSLAGDTNINVRDGIRALINANTYSVSVTTSITSAGYLRVVYVSNSDSAEAEVQTANSVLYQAGAVLVYNDDEYLIGNANSTTTYPAIPPIAASYDLNDLVLMPNGLKLHISEVGYTETVYNQTASGTADITGFTTQIYAPGINEVMINEDANQLVFGSDFGTEELVTIVFKL